MEALAWVLAPEVTRLVWVMFAATTLAFWILPGESRFEGGRS